MLQLKDEQKSSTEIRVKTPNKEMVAMKRIKSHFLEFGSIKKITGKPYDSKFLIEFCHKIGINKALNGQHSLKYSNYSQEDALILILDDDILGKIFKKLLPYDMKNFANTCKRFNRVYQNNLNFILKDLKLLDEMNNTEICAAFIEMFVTNYDIIEQTEGLNLIRRYFSELEKICITEKPVVRLGLLKNLKCLTTLKLVGCGLKNSDISLMKQFSKLEILDVSYNHKLTGAHLSNLQTIKELSLAGCKRVTADNFIEIFWGLFKLKALNIKECKLLSNEALNQMKEYCCNLEDFVITISPKGKYESLAFLPKLKKLKVYLKTINEYTRSFVRNLINTKTLESFELWLNFEELSLLQQIEIILEISNLTQLNRLIFSHRSVNQILYRSFFEELRHLTNLEYIGICETIREDDLLAILKECTKLNYITLKNPHESIDSCTIFKMIDILKHTLGRKRPVVFSAYNANIDLLILKDPRYLAAKSVLSVILDEREMSTGLLVEKYEEKCFKEIKVETLNEEVIEKERIKKYFSQFGSIKKIGESFEKPHKYGTKFFIKFHQKIPINALQRRHSIKCGIYSQEDALILILDDDILGKIFKKLLPYDMKNFANTCKRFNRVYQNNLNFILKDLKLLDEMNNPEICAAYIEMFVTNYDIIEQTEGLNLIRRYFSKLEKICITEKPVVRLGLLKNLECLTTLKLVRCGLKNSDISLMEQFSKLEILDVSYNYQLTGAYLSDLRTVNELSLAGCKGVGAPNFVEIFENLSNLKALNVMDCDLLSNHALNNMNQYCENLEDIVVTWDPDKINIASLPKLKKLKVYVYTINAFTSFIQRLINTRTFESFEVRLNFEEYINAFTSFIQRLINTRTLESFEVRLNFEELDSKKQKSLILKIAKLAQLKRLIFFDRSTNRTLSRSLFNEFHQLTNLEYIGICGKISSIDVLVLYQGCCKLKCLTVNNPDKSVNTWSIYNIIDLWEHLLQRENPIVFSAYNSGIDPSILEKNQDRSSLLTFVDYILNVIVFPVILDEKETSTELVVHKSMVEVEHFTVEVPILKLNNDCIEHILSKLARRDQIQFGIACKRFYNIYMDNLHLRLNEIVLNKRTWIEKNHTRVKSLDCGSRVDFPNISQFPLVNDIKILSNTQLVLNLCVNNMPNLKKLYLDRCELENEHVLQIVKLTALETLILFRINNITGEHMCDLKNLKELELRDCRGIESEHFVNIYKNLKELKSLSIIDCPQLKYDEFQKADNCFLKLVHLTLTLTKDVDYSWVTWLPKLRTLTITGSDSSSNQLEHILNELPKTLQLEGLNVKFMQLPESFANKIEERKHLKSCVLGWIENNYSNWIKALRTLEHLEEIDLGRMRDVSEIELLNLLRDCKKLKRIYLGLWTLKQTFFFNAIAIIMERNQKLLMERNQIWAEPLLIKVPKERISEEILIEPKIIEAERNHLIILSEWQD